MTYTNYGYACSAQYMPTAARAIKRDTNAIYTKKPAQLLHWAG
jgi:hypothetical protein